MISFTNLDKIEKLSKPAEYEDAESKFADFAALLSLPIEMPNNFANELNAADEKAVDEVTEANRNNFETSGKFTVPVQSTLPETQPDINVSSKNFNLDAQNSTLEAQDFSLNETQNFIKSKKADTQNQNDFQKDDLDQTNDIAFCSKSESIIKTAVKSGKMEILDVSEKNQIPHFSPEISFEKSSSTEKGKSEFVKSLSKFFGEVSSAFKNEKSPDKKPDQSFSEIRSEIKTSVSETSVSDVETVAFDNQPQIKSDAIFNKVFANFDQTEVGTPKAEKQLKSAEDFSVVGFEKISASATKELKNAEIVTRIPVKTNEIIEQIKPQMMQLLMLQNVENDKKMMKMRLHPAELGTVEIKLEKDSSGKLNAHFQTENEAAKQILTESIEQLRNSLHNSGWQIERLEISCAPFSSDGQADRENQSRQFETIETRLNNKTASEDASVLTDDSTHNRLLSVRA